MKAIFTIPEELCEASHICVDDLQMEVHQYAGSAFVEAPAEIGQAQGWLRRFDLEAMRDQAHADLAKAEEAARLGRERLEQEDLEEARKQAEADAERDAALEAAANSTDGVPPAADVVVPAELKAPEAPAPAQKKKK